jgi:uncharacterized protein (TIGR02453 family)
VPAAPFTSKSLTFLRSIKRNNNREWFHANRDEYEAHVRRPMMAVVEHLDREFRSFAPELMADPAKSIFRIWRDTRFSEDKRPLKTNIAARFPLRTDPERRGAGLYLHISGDEVVAGGGIYMPEPADLLRIRERIAANPTRFRTIVESPSFRRTAGGLQGDSLARVPRGFPPDHPAAAYLKRKQHVAFREWPATLATSSRFFAEIVSFFKATIPLVRYVNDAMGFTGARRPGGSFQEETDPS